MEKLKMQTENLADKNIEKIAKIFPNVITEKEDDNGNIKKAIDFDLLKQALSDVLVEDEDERYRLDWPGKKESLLKANLPITKTLRPVVEESVNFETTENLFIEGDNFEVLKILQESYLGKVKMIYIDPPYNTGKDFIYKDNFKISKAEYDEEIGMLDSEGGKLFKNTDSNGRFHSDWLSMMYERLIITRDLLKNDGLIFISIDDNEVANLSKICDEIFGEENFLADIVWKSGRTSSGHYTNENEYLLVYTKDKQELPYFEYRGEDNVSDRATKRPSDKNPLSTIDFPAGIDFESDDKIFPMKFGDSEPIEVVNGVFEAKNGKLAADVSIKAAWSMRDMILSWLKKEKVFDQKGQEIIRFFFKSNGVLQYEKSKGTIHPKTTISGISTKKGSIEQKYLFGFNYFDFPKPSELLNEIISPCSKSDDIVMDFFAGSSTTAHAVMQLNAEDGGNRKFIMVQLPEETDEESEACKAGYKNIAEIGKERIRRAGKKIKEEFLEKYQSELDKLKVNNPLQLDDSDEKKKELEKKIEHIKNLDTGFRVYKTDSSNMKDVYYHPKELKQEQLELLTSNIKEDRTSEDLLAQVILDLGLELSLPIEKKALRPDSATKGNIVFFVQTNALVACFDEDINFDIVDSIAEIKPLKVVFRDACFKDDKDRINVEERFKRLSPETVISVI